MKVQKVFPAFAQLALILSATACGQGEDGVQESANIALAPTSSLVQELVRPESFGFKKNVSRPGTTLWCREEGAWRVLSCVIEVDLTMQAAVFGMIGEEKGKPDNPGPYPMVGPNPNFSRMSLDDFWSRVAGSRPFAVVNGAFFDPKRDPTPSPFTIKQGTVVSAGNNMLSEFEKLGHIRLLRINNHLRYADIKVFDPKTYAEDLSGFDTVIGGLEEDAKDKSPTTYLGRTMVGVNGSKILIFVSSWSPASNPPIENGGADILRKFGSIATIMLGGGTTTQIKGLNRDPRGRIEQITTYISSRDVLGITPPTIPHVLTIFPGVK